jgi:hypothetical protein
MMVILKAQLMKTAQSRSCPGFHNVGGMASKLMERWLQDLAVVEYDGAVYNG